MLEDILGTLLRSQIGDLKKRTRWAVLEGAALGMVGLATVFLFIALQIWLSSRIEAWLSALIVAGAALLVALILMLVGRSFLQRSARRREQDFQSLLGVSGCCQNPNQCTRMQPTTRRSPELRSLVPHWRLVSFWVDHSGDSPARPAARWTGQ